ncbi:two-component sensor histidine kinase [Vibrio sp. UCD-FRSSP16_10]|uniref:ATP-binding protein n=1 Tax=unclassified Vibrio TaxID=2614977 RepID=UPI0007FDF276|nr:MULTISPECIES: ATP-binding protein [unclassified Vibrio]OBT16802.1 two-component sensor histidine kinase [Vibrio sp. UCD-FRSSP16_30]OBT21429.1 two-component sensor histidine kinase [Vibrio sp. UCD-FRSSP16_10]
MRKLIISLVVVVLASIVTLGWSISEYASQHETHSSSEVNRERIQALQLAGTKLARSLDDQHVDLPQWIDSWNKHNDEQLSLIDESQFPLPSSLKIQFESEGQLLLESDEGLSFNYRLPDTGKVLHIQTQLVPNPQVGPDLNKLYTLLFYAGIVLILLLWVSPLIKQLLNLSKVTKSFGSGELQQRITINRSSYIAEIETEFNRMADRIQQLIDDNKLLSRAVSHDLKTPIARLRFGIEAIEETDNETLRLKYFSRLNRDLDAMEELVSTLLNYARLDQANIQPNLEPIELNSWLEDKLTKSTLYSHEIEFIPYSQPLVVNSDPKYLSLQLGNLLSNAERFGRSKIRLQLTLQQGVIELSVDDDGQGVADQEVEQVIKPFVRGQQSRDNAGHGMGLAIVDRIGVWMGSELSIHRSKDLGGASMRLSFTPAKEIK